MHVQPRAVELLGHLQRLRGGAQQFVGAVRVGERAGEVAGHRRERGTGARPARRCPWSSSPRSPPRSPARRCAGPGRGTAGRGTPSRRRRPAGSSVIGRPAPSMPDRTARRAPTRRGGQGDRQRRRGRPRRVDRRPGRRRRGPRPTNAGRAPRRRRRATVPGRCARCRPAVRPAPEKHHAGAAAVAHGRHAGRAEHLAAHVVAVASASKQASATPMAPLSKRTVDHGGVQQSAVPPVGLDQRVRDGVDLDGLGARVEEPQARRSRGSGSR